jgi:hypothetical protein
MEYMCSVEIVITNAGTNKPLEVYSTLVLTYQL